MVNIILYQVGGVGLRVDGRSRAGRAWAVLGGKMRKSGNLDSLQMARPTYQYQVGWGCQNVGHHNETDMICT